MQAGALDRRVTLLPVDNVGFQIGVLHKQAEKLGVTRFNINDLTAKFKFQMSDNSRIGIKLAYYDENSNSTYIGLTQSMYDDSEYFPVIAPNDELDIRRYSASITHDYIFSNSTFLRTTVYGYTTTRNWLRQDFSRNTTSNGTGVVWGDTSIANGAIYMRNSTGNRNRQFEVAGVEPRVSYNYTIGNLINELEGGIRFHYERAFEQRIDGQSSDAKSGNLREDEIRTGYAESFFAQNRIYLTNRFTVIPGLRLVCPRCQTRVEQGGRCSTRNLASNEAYRLAERLSRSLSRECAMQLREKSRSMNHSPPTHQHKTFAQTTTTARRITNHKLQANESSSLPFQNIIAKLVQRFVDLDSRASFSCMHLRIKIVAPHFLQARNDVADLIFEERKLGELNWTIEDFALLVRGLPLFIRPLQRRNECFVADIANQRMLLRKKLLHLRFDAAFQNLLEYSTRRFIWDCVFRLSIDEAATALRVAEGEIPAGTKVLMLHFWNEHIPPMSGTEPGLSWGVKFRRRVGHSSMLLAST